MTADLLALIVLHFACADMSVSKQTTTSAERQRCSTIYEGIKLAFVPGVSARNYAGLSDAEQVAVNRAGYAAFNKWRVANSDTVLHLERVARGEETLKAPKDL